MLIKLQKGRGGAYYNIKDVQKMEVITERHMERSNFDGVLTYTIMINADSHTEYVASYQSKQDAEAELERFKSAWMNGDAEFEFAADDELVKKIEEAKALFMIEKKLEFEKFKQEYEQRHKEQFEEVKEQVEFDRALTKFFCYAATFLTYGAVIHLGVKYIKAPLPLAVTGILAGVIGAALVSYAKKQ